jgi:3-oxoadipate enol-lactonase
MDVLVDAWLEGAVSPQSHATHAGMVGLLRDMFLRNEPQSYAKSCRALADAPRIRRDEIGQPTLIVTGAHDRSTPLAMAEELGRRSRSAASRCCPTSGTGCRSRSPGALAATILEFLT